MLIKCDGYFLYKYHHSLKVFKIQRIELSRAQSDSFESHGSEIEGPEVDLCGGGGRGWQGHLLFEPFGEGGDVVLEVLFNVLDD